MIVRISSDVTLVNSTLNRLILYMDTFERDVTDTVSLVVPFLRDFSILLKN